MVLNQDALQYLADLYASDNMLSPLSERSGGDREKGRAVLAEDGVLVDGAINAQAKRWLDVLADPEGCGRVVMREGNVKIEKWRYRKGTDYLLAENVGSAVHLSAPESLSGTIRELSQITGLSRVIAFDVDEVLTPWEMLFYLGVLDLYRKLATLNLWRVAAERPNLEQLESHFNDPVPGSLVDLFLKFKGYAAPDKQSYAALQKTLVEKGIFLKEGLRLAGDHGHLGMRFLVPHAVSTLEVYEQFEDKVASAEAMIVSAGLNDHLLFEMSQEGVRIQMISGSFALKKIETALQVPELAL